MDIDDFNMLDRRLGSIGGELDFIGRTTDELAKRGPEIEAAILGIGKSLERIESLLIASASPEAIYRDVEHNPEAAAAVLRAAAAVEMARMRGRDADFLDDDDFHQIHKKVSLRHSRAYDHEDPCPQRPF